MKQNLLNKLWLRVGMIVAIMTTALAGTAGAEETTIASWGKVSISANTAIKASGGDAKNNGVAQFSSTKAMTTAGTNCYYGSSAGGAVITFSNIDLSDYENITMTFYTRASQQGTMQISYSSDGTSYTNLNAPSITKSEAQKTSDEIPNTATHIKLTHSASSGSLYFGTIVIKGTKTSGGSLTASDLALTGAPVALSFDLYNNSSAQTVSYTTSSTGAVTISGGDAYVTTSVNTGTKTITVTPTAVTPSAQTITVSQAADDTYEAGTVTFTVNITDSTPIPTHTATFSVNGETTTQYFEEGATITFPSNPAAISGKSFVGWVTDAISGTTNSEPSFVTSPTMGNSDVTFYAVFADVTPGTSTTVTDVLTRETTGVTSGAGYSSWSNKTVTSDAKYAGNSAGGNDAIQLRSTSNSGIVTTASGGKLKKVTINWNTNTVADRTLYIFGKNEAYESISDLYNDVSDGDLLASEGIYHGESTSSELTITGDYTYIGIRSKSGAMYLSSVSIDWETGTPDTYSNYCTTVVVTYSVTYDGNGATSGDVPTDATAYSSGATVTVLGNTGSLAKTGYAFGGWNTQADGQGNDRAAGSTFSITSDVTLYAKWNEKTCTTLSYTGTPAKTTYYEGEIFDPTGLTVTATYNDASQEDVTASVTWTPDPLTIGTTSVTGTYMGQTVNVSSLIVTAAPGTETNPYTVAQARAAIDAGTGVTGVYATGIVSAIVTVYSSQYHNISYNISADGLTTSDQLEVYRGKSYNGDNFTSEDDIQVGDIVVVYGDLTKYNSTYEFAQGNQLVSLDRPVVTTPTITVNTSSVAAPYAGQDGTITVTYNNITTVAADVWFCNAAGTDDATYDWIVAEINSSNNVEYVIDENDGAERTAYFKVWAYDDDMNKVYSNLVTVTQDEFVIDYATLPFEWTGGGKSELTDLNGVTAYGLGSDYAESNAPYRIKLDGENDYIQVKTNAQPVKVLIGVKMIGGGDTSKIKVQESADGSDFTDVEEFTISGSQNDILNFKTSIAFAASTRYVKIIKSAHGSNIGIGPITITGCETATLNSSGYATFASPYALDFSDDSEFSAWEITGVSGSAITFSQIKEAVAAGTGVLLKGTASTSISIPVATSGTNISSTNKLVGITTATAIEADTYYGLSGNTFVKVNAGTVPAGKALLPASVVDGSGVKAFTFVFEDDATGIEETLSNSPLKGENIYNLAGQMVNGKSVNGKLPKGIYIVNGKKVLK